MEFVRKTIAVYFTAPQSLRQASGILVLNAAQAGRIQASAAFAHLTQRETHRPGLEQARHSA